MLLILSCISAPVWALDYLLKPVDKDDLKLAMDKFIQKTKGDAKVNRLEVLLTNLSSQNDLLKRIIVPTISGFEIFEIADIIRCESNVNYTTIFLNNKKKLVVSKTLKEFEELLTDHGFFRIHNSHLVNLTYIKSYNRGKGGSVVLGDGTEIEVSTRRKDDFLKRVSEL